MISIIDRSQKCPNIKKTGNTSENDQNILFAWWWKNVWMTAFIANALIQLVEDLVLTYSDAKET
jgi:hypothetical protein